MTQSAAGTRIPRDGSSLVDGAGLVWTIEVDVMGGHWACVNGVRTSGHALAVDWDGTRVRVLSPTGALWWDAKATLPPPPPPQVRWTKLSTVDPDPPPPPPSSSSPFTVGLVGYSRLQDAFDALNDGGILGVKGGSVFNDQAGYLRRNGITMRTDSGRARFRTATVGAKACIVQQGANFTTMGIEGEGFSVSDLNGAFIRQEAPGLHMMDGILLGNQDGVLGNNLADNLVVFERMTFDHNGAENGQAHGIYIGYGLGSEVRVLDCNGISANVGHFLKVRTQRLLVDGGTWNKGTGSRVVDAACGGIVELMNMVCFQDDATNNSSFFGIGTDVAPAGYPVNSFTIRASVTIKNARHNGWNLLDNLVNATVIQEAFTFVDMTKMIPPLPAVTGPFKAVPNTRMDQLVPLLRPDFRERGNTGFSSKLSAWSGCAQRGTKLILVTNGGHDDSNNDGIEIYDSAPQQNWSIALQPSAFDDQAWAESNAMWAAIGKSPTVNRSYDPNKPYVWKDGQHVSTHSYGLTVDAAEFGVFHLRDGVRRYDPTTWARTDLSGPVGGANEFGGDAYAFYLPASKEIYVCGDVPTSSGGYDYGSIFRLDPATGANVKVMSNGGQLYNTEMCQMEDGRVFQFMRFNGVSSIIDFIARTRIDTPPLSDLFSSDLLVALGHSNKTGILALRLSGRLSGIDPVTGKVTDLGDSGIPSALLNVSARVNRTWLRWKLVTMPDGSQKFVFPIETNSDVYEMAI